MDAWCNIFKFQISILASKLPFHRIGFICSPEVSIRFGSADQLFVILSALIVALSYYIICMLKKSVF